EAQVEVVPLHGFVGSLVGGAMVELRSHRINVRARGPTRSVAALAVHVRPAVLVRPPNAHSLKGDGDGDLLGCLSRPAFADQVLERLLPRPGPRRRELA